MFALPPYRRRTRVPRLHEPDKAQGQADQAAVTEPTPPRDAPSCGAARQQQRVGETVTSSNNAADDHHARAKVTKAGSSAYHNNAVGPTVARTRIRARVSNGRVVGDGADHRTDQRDNQPRSGRIAPDRAARRRRRCPGQNRRRRRMCRSRSERTSSPSRTGTRKSPSV